MRIAVFGAGAMGSLLGARLSRGNDVTLIGRGPHMRAVAHGGLRVEGFTRGTFRIGATTRAEGAVGAELVFLTTKSFDTMAAARALRRAGVRAPVVSLQNGLTNIPTLLKELPSTDLVGGSTTHGVTFLGPGSIRHAGAGETFVGSARGGDRLARSVAALLSSARLPTRATRALEAVLWRKAVVNAAINPVTAVLGVANGRILEDTESRLVSRLAAGEAAQVAAAEGAAVARPWDAVLRVLQATSGNRSSMLQDRLAGRRTEIESITGEVVRRAKRHRLPVPVNAGLLDAVRSL